MTLDEARKMVARTTTPEAARGAFIQAGAVDYHQAAAPAERTRLEAAMWTLLDEGEDWERDLAVRFFSSIVVPDEIRRRLVGAYVAEDWDSGDPRARLLAGLKLAPPEIAALRRLYSADPERHAVLLQPLLTSDEDGAIWRAFAAGLEQVDDAAVLLNAYEKVLLAPKWAKDFYALLAKKGEPLVRTVAAGLGSFTRKKLLLGCGLPAD